MLSYRPIRLGLYILILVSALAWFIGHAGTEMAKIQGQVYINHDQFQGVVSGIQNRN